MAQYTGEFFARAYTSGDAPWDSGVPSTELVRVVEDGLLPGKSLLELGCGTGTNAVELARRGYTVTAVDSSELAIEPARAKAAAAGVQVDFRVADILASQDLGGPYDVLFDRGLYHGLRIQNLVGFQRCLEHVSRPGTRWLCLAGNANEATEYGPPRVSEDQIRADLEGLFEILELREFRFDLHRSDMQPLGWSILLKRRG